MTEASVALHAGAFQTYVDAPVQYSESSNPLPPNCSPKPPVLRHGETRDIFIGLHLADAFSGLFQVALTVTTQTDQGSDTLVLPSAFVSTLVFASYSFTSDGKVDTHGQFICYEVNGNRFVPMNAYDENGCS
jgi:hypothetical protein